MIKQKHIFIALFFISIFFNIALSIDYSWKQKNEKNDLPQAFSYRLISPSSQTVIDSNIQNPQQIIHYTDLKPKIETEIKKYSDTNNNVGVFLQDANTGAWLGINERTGFNPASLLKIPIMLAILKKVELEEISLNDALEIIEEDLDKNSGELYKKGAGYKISVWEFIKEMILSSDNTAKNVLRRQLADSELNSIFTHIGIPNPYIETSDHLVTPRGYARLFKSLYFSTYLSPKLSEKALEISTDTKMENLLSAEIPYEIQVAHKYGERPDGLSDCGIIYHPQNPYYLCIMTRDLEIPQAKELIANISKIIYQFTSESNQK